MKPQLVLLFLILGLCVTCVLADQAEDDAKAVAAAKLEEYKKFLKIVSGPYKVCNERHRVYYHKVCFEKSTEFDLEVRAKPLNNSNLDYYNSKCYQLINCFFPISCMARRRDYSIGNRLHEFCGTQVWAKGNFSTCAEKLVKAKSECYAKWAPYPDIFFGSRFDEAEEQEKAAVCKKYFGQDGCMENEVKKTCGEDYWIEFRDHFVELNAVTMRCELPYEPIDRDEGPLIRMDKSEYKSILGTIF